MSMIQKIRRRMGRQGERDFGISTRTLMMMPRTLTMVVRASRRDCTKKRRRRKLKREKRFGKRREKAVGLVLSKENAHTWIQLTGSDFFFSFSFSTSNYS